MTPRIKDRRTLPIIATKTKRKARKRNPVGVDSKCQIHIMTDGTTGSSKRMIWHPALDK